MQPQKKSRKFSVIAAILILLTGILIGGYLVLKSHGAAGQLASVSASLSSCEPNPDDAAQDSDNDGLKDWQEMQIYNSDPCKADTDGDGYLDDEEVTSGYDPTKKAPGDELPGTMPKNPRPLPDNINLTQELQRKLKDKIIQNKLSPFSAEGKILSGQELEENTVIQEVAQEVNSYGDPFAPDKIDDNEIKISEDNSIEAILRYLVKAGPYFVTGNINGQAATSRNEGQIFLSAIENNDFSELDRGLKGYMENYENLKNLTVPNDLVSLHKEQLNIISSLIKIYQAIKIFNIDQYKAFLASNYYRDVIQQLMDWSQKLANFVESRQ